MRIELNHTGQIVYPQISARSERTGHATAANQRIATVPVLDWPDNLFSSTIAMADETATYQ